MSRPASTSPTVQRKTKYPSTAPNLARIGSISGSTQASAPSAEQHSNGQGQPCYGTERKETKQQSSRKALMTRDSSSDHPSQFAFSVPASTGAGSKAFRRM